MSTAMKATAAAGVAMHARTELAYTAKLRPLLEAGRDDLAEYDLLTPAEREAMQDVRTPSIAAGSVLAAAVTGNIS
ncbi:hypothetical protein AB0I68_32950 [Streptomyces sp. NPDC050448]|uniref:hypothetical protein n=1 Tax=Streptomyces sp. NPDC050448 TaxID=3155404 RepID=UPI003433F769